MEFQKTKLEKQFDGFLKTPPVFTTISNEFSFQNFKIPSKILTTDFSLKVKENLMLGKRVETFFKYILQNSSTYSILAENIQIFEEKRTVGEIDFILQNEGSKEKIHVEVAYKFYLYDPSISSNELENWVGPNKNDSLIQKIQKLTQKQFPLLYSDWAKPYFSKINLNPNTIQQQVCFKAQLFIPYHNLKTKFKHINSKCIVGFYIHIDAFLETGLMKNSFHIPDKQDWLVDPKSNLEWNTFDTVSEALQLNISKQKSPLVWMKDNSQKISSLFVIWW